MDGWWAPFSVEVRYALRKTDAGRPLRLGFSVAPLKDSCDAEKLEAATQGKHSFTQKLLMNTLKITGSAKEHESAVVPK